MIRSSVHRAIVREKHRQIADLLALVQSQSERLLVVAGYRPLLPQRPPSAAPVPDPAEAEARRLFADLTEL